VVTARNYFNFRLLADYECDHFAFRYAAGFLMALKNAMNTAIMPGIDVSVASVRYFIYMSPERDIATA